MTLLSCNNKTILKSIIIIMNYFRPNTLHIDFPPSGDILRIHVLPPS